MLRNMFNDSVNKKQNPPIFIVKPGEDSNRGNGIELADNYFDLRKLIDGRSTH